MSAILPFLQIDRSATLANHFLLHQLIATHAHTENTHSVGAAVLLDNGSYLASDGTIKWLPAPPEWPT